MVVNTLISAKKLKNTKFLCNHSAKYLPWLGSNPHPEVKMKFFVSKNFFVKNRFFALFSANKLKSTKSLCIYSDLTQKSWKCKNFEKLIFLLFLQKINFQPLQCIRIYFRVINFPLITHQSYIGERKNSDSSGNFAK